MKKYYFVASFKNGELKWLQAFDNKEAATEILNTEEYDFRDREMFSKTAAIKRFGKKEVEEAIYIFEHEEQY